MAILGNSRIKSLEVLENLKVDGNLEAGNIEQTLSDNSTKIPSSKAVTEGTISNIEATAEQVSASSPVEVTVTTENRVSTLHFKIPTGTDGAQGGGWYRSSASLNTGSTSVARNTIPGLTSGKPILFGDTIVDVNGLVFASTAQTTNNSIPIQYRYSIHGTDGADGVSPVLLVVDNDNYVFSYPGGASSTLELPVIVSRFKILEGNTELPFSITESSSGWWVNALFLGIADDDAELEENSSFFDGTIDANGNVSVTTVNKDLRYGEIKLTATKGSETLETTVSVRFVRSAGFATPSVSTSTLNPGSNATVSVTADASTPEYAKKFNFTFGIPRGDEPIFISLSPDTVAIPSASNGTPLSGGAVSSASTVRIYKGTTDDTANWTLAIDSKSSGISCNISNKVVNITAFPSSLEYGTITVKATKGSATIKKSLMVYKSRAGDTGPAPTIQSDVNFTLGSATGQVPSGSASFSKTGEGTYKLNLTLNGLADRAYLPIGSIFLYGGKNTPVGAAELSGGTLTKASYPDFYTWAQNNAPTTTESDYNSQISSQGSCGLFVVTSTGVKLPTIKTFVEGGTVSDLGKYTGDQGRKFSANITMDGLGVNTTATADGIASVANNSSVAAPSYNNAISNGVKITLDSSKAWGSSANGTEFRPKSIRYRYFIQVYNTVNNTLSSVQMAQLAAECQSAQDRIDDLQTQINNIRSSLATGSLSLTGTLTV